MSAIKFDQNARIAVFAGNCCSRIMHESAIERVHNERIFNVVNTTNKSIQSGKVIDHIRRRANMKRRFYSIEVSNIGNLTLDFNEFTVQPLFTSVTWIKDKVENELQMPAVQLRNLITSTPTLMHLTCQELDEMNLNRLLESDIDSILALRGDIVAPNQPFKYAIDLIRLIKQKRPQISICVAGYPDVHHDAESSQSDLKHLKEKVDAGADFIITQVCFSAANVLHFIAECRKIGITVPIIPGIFVASSFDSLNSMCRICKTKVPDEDFQMYKKLKDDKIAFQDFAVQTTFKFLSELFQNDVGPIVGVHFFTLNKFDQIKQVVDIFGFE